MTPHDPDCNCTACIRPAEPAELYALVAAFYRSILGTTRTKTSLNPTNQTVNPHEPLPSKQRVAGSSPAAPTKNQGDSGTICQQNYYKDRTK